MSKRELSRIAGFTLVELSVAIGAGAVVLLALSSVVSNSVSQKTAVGVVSDFNSMTAAVQLLMGNSAGCKANLKGQTFQTNQLTVPRPLSTLGVNTAGGTIAIMKAPWSLNNGNLTINTIDLRNFNQIGATSAYAAQIHLTATQKVRGGVGSTSLQSDVPVLLFTTVVANTATIQSCSNSASANPPPTPIAGGNVQGSWTLNCFGPCGKTGTFEIAFGTGYAQNGAMIPLPGPLAQGWTAANMTVEGGVSVGHKTAEGVPAPYTGTLTQYSAGNGIAHYHAGVFLVGPNFTSMDVARGDGGSDTWGSTNTFFTAFAWTKVP